MSEKPIISIVLPTFNQALLLREALDSIVAQTTDAWEALIIDNQSTDDTRAVVEAFSEPRFRYSEIDNQGIIAASRNQAIQQARGDWVAFLDSDDIWMPEKLAECLGAVDSEVDLICHREHTVRDGHVLRTSSSPVDSWPSHRNLWVHGNCFSPSSVMVRRQLLQCVGGFSERSEFVTCEDYDLWLRLVEYGMRVKFIDPILSQYRLHDSNASTAIERHMKANMAVIDDHFERLSPRKRCDYLTLIRRRAEALYGGGRSYAAAGQMREARALYLRAVCKFPLSARPYAAWLLSWAP